MPELPPSDKPIPALSGGWPLLGHLPEFYKDPVGMLHRCWSEHGELVRFRLGTRDFVLFTGPEAHDAYFRAPEDQLDARAVYQFTVPIFGRGVAYDVAPEIMAEQLGFLFPALRDASMRRYARIMYEEASQFADSLGDEGTIDLPVRMNELTVNIASRCLLGEEVRNQVDSGFAQAYHDLEEGINPGASAPRPGAPPRCRNPCPGDREPPAVGRGSGGFHAGADAGPLQGRSRFERWRGNRNIAHRAIRRTAHQRRARNLDRP